MGRITQAGVQWLVLMLLGAAGFTHEFLTTKSVPIMTLCAGMMGSPYAFSKKETGS